MKTLMSQTKKINKLTIPSYYELKRLAWNNKQRFNSKLQFQVV